MPATGMRRARVHLLSSLTVHTPSAGTVRFTPAIAHNVYLPNPRFVLAALYWGSPNVFG